MQTLAQSCKSLRPHQTYLSSDSTIETLEMDVKYVQS